MRTGRVLLSMAASAGSTVLVLLAAPRGGAVSTVPLAGAEAIASARATDGVDVELVAQVGGWVPDVALSGRHAYVGVGPRLVVVDASDPSAPRVVGRSPVLPGVVRSVTMSGRHAYVARLGGISIVDVSNPLRPREVGRLDLRLAADVDVVGTHAYVAAGNGIEVLDVADPTVLRRVGATFDTTAYAVQVEDGHAFVAAGEDGLAVYDVTVPSAPRLVSVRELERDAERAVAGGLVVRNGFAYVAMGSSGLAVLDVREPTSPAVVGWLDGGSRLVSAGDVVLDGSRAIVLEHDLGLCVIDVSDPTAPRPVERIALPGLSLGLAVGGGYAWVATLHEGVRVVDLTPPALDRRVPGALEEQASRRVVANLPAMIALGVDVGGGHAYIDVAGYGLRVIDLDAPGGPAVQGGLRISWRPLRLRAAEDRLWAASWSRLDLLDVSAGDAPRKIGELVGDFDMRDVDVAGSRAYVASGEGLVVVDADPWGNLRERGRARLGPAHVVDVDGRHAYVLTDQGTDGGYLVVLDVADPAAPRELGRLARPMATDVAVDGNRALVIAEGQRLQVVDVSTPASPREVAVVDVAASEPHPLDASDGIGLVVRASQEVTKTDVVAYDVGGSAAPRPVALIRTPGMAASARIVADRVYVADTVGGLAVYRLIRGRSFLPWATP